MNGMDDLITFLRARLAEAEAVIRKNLGINGLGDDGSYPDYRTYIDDDTSAADEFLTLFSPHRMLADVAAKRQIIDEHSVPWTAALEGTVCNVCCLGWPCKTMRLLALPHADHPDYRTEWRP